MHPQIPPYVIFVELFLIFPELDELTIKIVRDSAYPIYPPTYSLPSATPLYIQKLILQYPTLTPINPDMQFEVPYENPLIVILMSSTKS